MFILLSLVALGLALEPEYGVPPVLLPDPYVPEDTNYQPQNPGYPLNPGPVRDCNFFYYIFSF